jgi:hypothetical protein
MALRLAENGDLLWFIVGENLWFICWKLGDFGGKNWRAKGKEKIKMEEVWKDDL